MESSKVMIINNFGALQPPEGMFSIGEEEKKLNRSLQINHNNLFGADNHTLDAGELS